MLLWFCFCSPVECYSMDSWCWLRSRCPLWKIYSETHYRLCEWSKSNGRRVFFPGGFTSPPAAQRTHEAGGCPSPSDFTSVWRHQTHTPRRGHAPPPIKPLPLFPTLHPEWTTASWSHTHPNTLTRTNIAQIVIYYGFNLLWMNQGLRLALCSVQ